jgi:hypothetical protein
MTPFRGTVTLLRANPNFRRVWVWGTLALLPLVATIAFLPEGAKKTAAPILIFAFVAAFGALLSRALVPSRQTVELVADARGLFANGAAIVARAEITRAYLRPAIAAWSSKNVRAPAWPMTVEIVSARGQLNVDAGSEDAARSLLASLGFPATVVARHHVAKTPENAEWKRIGWIVVIAVNLGIVLIAVLAAWLRD